MKLLEGIRVLDMTNVLAGPFATLHLALSGAEVVKIENPDGGDLARKLGNVPSLNDQLMGTSFLAQNANKKSLTLNLKEDAAKEIFRRLVRTGDVLVENFRPGVMARLGLSYSELAQINPRLVYCAISGFGQSGPDAFKPAYDQIVQGLSGVMAINGDERLNPLRCGFPVCDTVGGLNAAFAIMGALYHRERSGRGQFIDVALLDSVMPLLGWVAANWLIGGKAPQLLGNDNMTAAPSGTFVTKDGYVNIAANQQEQWENVCDVVGVPELKTDPRFQKRDARKANRKALTPLLEARLREKPTAHWVEALNKKGVPSGEILSLEDALAAPQIAHRQTIQTVVEPGIGPLKLFNLTAKFEETPGSIDAPPPRLSAHTDQLLKELGYTDTEIAAFREKKVVWGMDESLRSRVQRIAGDRGSGASELLGLALEVLRDARRDGPLVLMEAAREVCRAQPSMASFWNAAAVALADVEHPGTFERFAARAERSASALVRFATALLAPVDERDRPLLVSTCSFSGSVLSCLEEVARVRPLSVACAEGRPALEGRRLAARLAAAGAQVESWTDAGIAATLHRTGALVVGADAVSSEWVLNKCGTSALAAACAGRGIPVYVIASREKFLAPALAPLVQIVEHPAEEVWEGAPPGVTVRNVYFERVPLEWVTSIVTDAGVLGVDMVIEACQAQGTWLTPEIVASLGA